MGRGCEKGLWDVDFADDEGGYGCEEWDVYGSDDKERSVWRYGADDAKADAGRALGEGGEADDGALEDGEDVLFVKGKKRRDDVEAGNVDLVGEGEEDVVSGRAKVGVPAEGAGEVGV